MYAEGRSMGRFTCVCTKHGCLLEHEQAPVSGYSARIVDIDLSWSNCPLVPLDGSEDDCSEYWEVVNLSSV